MTTHRVGWRFENSYAGLPEIFSAAATPAKVRDPRVVVLNHQLAGELGLNFQGLPEAHAAALFAGQELPAGCQPIAQAYAGHQFGGFTMLGDGRAILLGEQRTNRGELFDIQLKGPGPTRYSRRGDGRAALGPMLREYIISEAMHSLGIPTTRSLAVVTTGEPVFRETPQRGAILTRVAASHIRVGTFEFIAAREDEPNLRILADYTIARHYPEIADQPEKYLSFLLAVLDRQAMLIARWQLVGFIHGVMNTDNMAISGESIDYGPCAFLDVYHPGTVFSSIDREGRYAYGNQPNIAQWNLARFAETLLPLIDEDQKKAIALATELLGEFAGRFKTYWSTGMRQKLGLQLHIESDIELIGSLLDWMQKTEADFTITFRDLSEPELPANELYRTAEFQAWHVQWQSRLVLENRTRDLVAASMRAVNPAIIPRNYRVEAALAAAENGDLSVLHELLAALHSPYETSAKFAKYSEPPPASFRGYRTFCGT
jgi:serine/tyrosine/threonine adenylyltransferase